MEEYNPTPPTPPAGEPKKGGILKWIIIIIVITVVLGSCIAGIAYYMGGRSNTKTPEEIEAEKNRADLQATNDKLKMELAADEAKYEKQQDVQLQKAIIDKRAQIKESENQLAIINRTIATNQSSTPKENQSWIDYLTSKISSPSTTPPSTTSPPSSSPPSPPEGSNGVKCKDDIDCGGFEYACQQGYCVLMTKVTKGDVVQQRFTTTAAGVCASNENLSEMVAEGLVKLVDTANKTVHIEWYALKNNKPISTKPAWECGWIKEDSDAEWVTKYLGDENKDPSVDYGLKSVMTYKEVAKNINIIPQGTLKSQLPQPILVTQSGCYYYGDAVVPGENLVSIGMANKCRVGDAEAQAVLCKDVIKSTKMEILGRTTKYTDLPQCIYQPRGGPGGDCSTSGVCLPGSVCQNGKCFEVCDDKSKIESVGCPTHNEVPRASVYSCDYSKCADLTTSRRAEGKCWCCDETGKCDYVETGKCVGKPSPDFPGMDAKCKYV